MNYVTVIIGLLIRAIFSFRQTFNKKIFFVTHKYVLFTISSRQEVSFMYSIYD